MLEYIHQFGEDRVAGMVLVDDAPCLLKSDDWPFGQSLPEWQQWIRCFEDDRIPVANRMVDQMFVSQRSESELHWIVKQTARTPTTVATALSYALALTDRRAYLAEITTPTLLIMQGKSRDLGEVMQSRIPRSRLKVFDQAGHALFLEQSKSSTVLLLTL